MSNILSKIMCSFFITLALSSSVKAVVKADTTQLLANNKANVSPGVTTTIIREANIIYPISIKASMNESLDYVQNFSNKKRDYLIHTYQKGKKYFPKITAILKRYNLPQELKVLIAMESGFNPNAVSGAGAVGYWQIMDDVAKEYGLHIVSQKSALNTKDKITDDRKNLSKSTLVAAKYLHDRCKNVNNDLLLMVASYNCGIGKVWQAMKRSGKSNPGFWDIKKFLPAETKAYVMNFIAMNVIFENYDNFVKNKLIFNSRSIEVLVAQDVMKINTSATD